MGAGLALLLNSEDAASLAEFYNLHLPPARTFLKPKQAELKQSIMKARSEEIKTDDPDHLEAILGDLYRIEGLERGDKGNG